MIETTVDEKLRVVRFNRPEKRNALTPEGMESLEQIFEEATEPVVYLTGSGKAFSAGADLSLVSELDPAAGAKYAARGQDVARSIALYDGAVIAGIDGPARGGGVELALACDMRIATPEATFAQSGVEIGLFGSWGGTARLPRIVGEGNAQDISLTGRVIDANEALRMGLVSQVVEKPRRVAEEMLDNDFGSVRAIKHRIADDGSQDVQEEREVDVFSELISEFMSE